METSVCGGDTQDNFSHDSRAAKYTHFAYFRARPATFTLQPLLWGRCSSGSSGSASPWPAAVRQKRCALISPHSLLLQHCVKGCCPDEVTRKCVPFIFRYVFAEPQSGQCGFAGSFSDPCNPRKCHNYAAADLGETPGPNHISKVVLPTVQSGPTAARRCRGLFCASRADVGAVVALDARAAPPQERPNGPVRYTQPTTALSA